MRSIGRRLRDSGLPGLYLSAQQPHDPACHEDSANKHSKTIQAVADLLAGQTALGNSKDDRSKQGEQQGSGFHRSIHPYHLVDIFGAQRRLNTFKCTCLRNFDERFAGKRGALVTAVREGPRAWVLRG